MKLDDINYINERVDSEIKYYDLKSISNQRKYKILAAIQIFCSAVIIAISGLSKNLIYSDWIIAVLGIAIAVATGFQALGKYQERWINFRTTCETLRHLKYLYLAGVKPFKGENAFDRFVIRIETTISSENSEWGTYVTNSEDS